MARIESKSAISSSDPTQPDEYRAWAPFEELPDDLLVDALIHDAEGMRILLRSEDPTQPTLRVLFDSIVSYRNVNESFRLRTWTRFPHGLAGNLFRVENSSWIEWLRGESGGVLDDVPLVHYAILTGEDCVDIAAEFPPSVEWLGSQ